MAYSDGDDFVVGAILSFQQAIRMKNNWRAAAAVSNPSAGMLFSNSGTDKLSHRQTAAWGEIWQAGVIASEDMQIGDNKEVIFGAGGDGCIGHDNGDGSCHISSGSDISVNKKFSWNNTGIGFYGTAPIARPAAIADATGAGNVVDRVNDVIHALENLGLITL